MLDGPHAAHRHLEHRVSAQAVAVVGVRVINRDPEHLQPPHRNGATY